MLISVLVFLPIVVTLFWTLLYMSLAFRTKTLFSYICLMGVTMMAEFSIACYFDPASSWTVLLVASNLSQFFTPCVVPLLMIYMYVLRTREKIHVRQALWVVAPIVLFTVAEITSFLAGREEMEAFLKVLYTDGFSAANEIPGKAVRMYYISAVYGFRTVILIEVIAMIGSFLTIYRKEGYSLRNLHAFFWKGERISIVELQYANLVPVFIVAVVEMFMFRDFLIQHVWVAVVLSILLTAASAPFCAAALFSAKRKLSVRHFFYASPYNYSPETKGHVLSTEIETMITDNKEDLRGHLSPEILAPETNTQGAAGAAAYAAFNTDGASIGNPGGIFGGADASANGSYNSAVVGMVGSDRSIWPARDLFSEMLKKRESMSLAGRFERLMINEHIFLQPGLTLVEVADMLGTNKTYISKMVNSTYGLPFPDVINILRVNFAAQYLVANRDATQTDVAQACGFASASAFNNTFKKVTGMTPRIWLATYDSRMGNM